MRSSVRYVAAAAASLLVFAACSGENAATPTSPDLAAGSLNYSISPAQVSWTRIPGNPTPVDTRTVLISGLIAVGGYPQFGAMQYTGANDWLEMSTVPDLSRSPLGWRFTFRLKPKAATLPIGRYTATIPVTVQAAQNNPQSIVVTFNHCDNCLFVGDVRVGTMTASTPRYDRNTFNGAGDYPYLDWLVFVEPGATVYVQNIGSAYVVCNETGPLGTISDPWLQIFDGTTSIGASDDACGYASQVAITNNTGVRKQYTARAGSLGTYPGSHNPPGYLTIGTYTIRVRSVPFGGNNNNLRAVEPTFAETLAKVARDTQR